MEVFFFVKVVVGFLFLFFLFFGVCLVLEFVGYKVDGWFLVLIIWVVLDIFDFGFDVGFIWYFNE